MSDKFYIGDRLADVQSIAVEKPIDRVLLLYDDEHGIAHAPEGAGDGLELTAECYFATAAIAEKVYNAVKEYQYHAYAAQGADLDPAAELGDGITTNGIYSVLARYADDGLGYPDIEAPGEAELEEEFPADGPLTQQIKRKVTLGEAYEGVRITRANGLEVVKTLEDGTEKARAQLKSDLLAFYDDNGAEALYFDPTIGRYVFRGDIVITGNIKMGAGQITWTDGGIDTGISETDAVTIIDRQLVSSPNIAGGRFLNLNQNTWVVIGEDRAFTGDGSGPGLKLCNDVFQQTIPIFEVWSGPSYNTGFSAKNHYFLDIDEYYDAETQTSTGVRRASPRGVWDFSEATVTGLTLKYT